jgi:predicted RNase H-like HicB family nuclease
MFRVELDREEDGRWIAEIPDLPGVLAYGETRDDAIRKVTALAGQVEQAATDDLPQRRRQSNLSYWLFAFLLVSIVLGTASTWWINRQRAFNYEMQKFEGVWEMINDDGTIVVLPSGRRITETFSPRKIRINPFKEPKQLDFVSSTGPDGDLLAIYRWEGHRLRIKVASPELERPVAWESQRVGDVKSRKNAPQPNGPVSVTNYLLRRSVEAK